MHIYIYIYNIMVYISLANNLSKYKEDVSLCIFFFHSNVVINDLFIEIQVMINYILTYIHKIFKGKKK